MMRFSLLLFVLMSGLFDSAMAQDGQMNSVLPGFVRINDSVFMAKTELDIREYARFMVIWRKISHDSGLLHSAMPASQPLGWTYWTQYDHSLIQYDELYSFIDKSFQSGPIKDTSIGFKSWIGNWPVVNVTRGQAALYCIFRADDYGVFYNSLSKKQKLKYPSDLVFRLPTSSEWIEAARAGLDTSRYPFGVDQGLDMIPVSKDYFAADTTRQLHPYPVGDGFQNNIGLYHMCGNVAEMVADEDFVYGGSYKDLKERCTAVSKASYTGPQPYVGFRVVAVIRKR